MTDAKEAVFDRVLALLDKADVVEVLDLYVHHLDFSRDTDSWLSSVFDDDVEVVYPTGVYRGLAELSEFGQMANSAAAHTHHVMANHRVVLDGDKADVTAHLTAVHVRGDADSSAQFAIGGHCTAAVVRTAAGWRVRRFVFTLVWRRECGPDS
ncbi:nuclear transport factor 2 family protein [Nocardia halotolerans]|uniref:Nuclear transport factor 2 family protein n=1 Tax=Nocardia halotolerans TaxID=1755878 RepID=A0ABV8VFL8_9NOCA